MGARVRITSPHLKSKYKNKKNGKSNRTNKQRFVGIIEELKKRSSDQKVNLWRRIALDLEKPTRQRRVVNLSSLSRFTKENEIIVVPGKVLGAGSLNHKITISAFSFSDGAKEKIEKQAQRLFHCLI